MFYRNVSQVLFGGEYQSEGAGSKERVEWWMWLKNSICMYKNRMNHVEIISRRGKRSDRERKGGVGSIRLYCIHPWMESSQCNLCIRLIQTYKNGGNSLFGLLICHLIGWDQPKAEDHGLGDPSGWLCRKTSCCTSFGFWCLINQNSRWCIKRTNGRKQEPNSINEYKLPVQALSPVPLIVGTGPLGLKWWQLGAELTMLCGN
jgi:hypothetical protein